MVLDYIATEIARIVSVGVSPSSVTLSVRAYHSIEKTVPPNLDTVRIIEFMLGCPVYVENTSLLFYVA